jgi:hypothetical protein
MPFGYRKKGEEEEEEQRRLRPIATNVTDKEDLEEINKISNMLNPNEEVFVVARQSRLKPGGSKFTPNIVYATDRRIIIRDPRMLGLREEVVDIPYDLISSVRLDKGVFSSSVIFTAPGLRSSGRLGLIEKMAGTEFSPNEDAVITAIQKDKAEDLVEVIRNGMDRQREVYQQQQPQRINVSTNNNNNNNDNSPTISIADELTKLAKLKEQGVISESEFQQMKQDLLKKT